jgi:nucleotide-binding universal stress UspA family protein
MLDPTRVRVLLPTAGGPNTPEATLLAAGLAKRSAEPISLLLVRAPSRLRDRLLGLFRRQPPAPGVDDQLAAVRRIVEAHQPPVTRRVEHPSIAHAIVQEAQRGFDLIVIGASHRGHSLGGPVLADVVERAPCHVLVVKAGPSGRTEPYRHLLVPFDGGVFARGAVELAVRYAEATSAEITIAILSQSRSTYPARLTDPNLRDSQPDEPEEDSGDLTRISNIFRATDVRPHLVHLRYDPTSSAMTSEAESGKYDLVVVGAENRAVQHRLFFGHDNERLIRNASVTVAIAIPNVAYLGKDDPSAIASLQRPGTPADGAPAASRAASSA